MKTLYLGELDFFGHDLIELLEGAGHVVDTGQPRRNRRYDLVVDNASRSPVELRAVLAAHRNRARHYVFISTSRVYPPLPRLTPWQEDEIDVAVDLSHSLPPEVRRARAVERELRLLCQTGMPFTILRPASVDGPGAPHGLTHWFVDRVLDGGLVVLPEGDLPTYRHVAAADLAGAVLAVAGRSEAFNRVMNVTSQALLSYWGHAAMVRDGLSHPLRFAYVPAWRWRSEGLGLPMGEWASSSFIAASPALHALGWRPGDSFEFVTSLARYCAEHRQPTGAAVIDRERQVLRTVEVAPVYTPGIPPAPLAPHRTRQWVLRGWSGRPASLALERLENVQQLATPIVKVQALVLTPPEESFLRGEYHQSGPRAIGHNALLEVMQPGKSALNAGSMMVPVATLPCADPDCPFCVSRAHAILGIGGNGYGLGVCTTPPAHLVPAPPALGKAVLLADSLATLETALCHTLADEDGPVWIAGRTFEAALAAWLAQDAGRPVLHVDRLACDHPEFPTQSVSDALEQVQAGKLPQPTLAVDLTGCMDVTWPLAHALQAGSRLFVRRRPMGVPNAIRWTEMEAAAPDRARLEHAMATLERWSVFRNLDARMGPAVPLDIYWDALLPSPFSLPWLEDRT